MQHNLHLCYTCSAHTSTRYIYVLCTSALLWNMLYDPSEAFPRKGARGLTAAEMSSAAEARGEPLSFPRPRYLWDRISTRGSHGVSACRTMRWSPVSVSSFVQSTEYSSISMAGFLGIPLRSVLSRGILWRVRQLKSNKKRGEQAKVRGYGREDLEKV